MIFFFVPFERDFFFFSIVFFSFSLSFFFEYSLVLFSGFGHHHSPVFFFFFFKEGEIIFSYLSSLLFSFLALPLHHPFLWAFLLLFSNHNTQKEKKGNKNHHPR